MIMSCKSNRIHWLDIDRDMRTRMASQKKQHQCKNLPFLHRLTMEKIAPPGVAAQKGGKQLSLEARIDAVVTLAWMADGMHLPPGAIAKVADASIVSETAIRKIWSRMKAGETPSSIVITKKTGNKNAKTIGDETLVLQIQGLDINFRRSIRDIAANTGVSIGTIQGLVRKGLLKKRRQNLKPLLTNDHKLLWVAWIRNLIEDDGTYCDMMQYVHINEK